MPEIQEVFRMATQKVGPEPGALERQHGRARRRAIRQKVAVYSLVAAFVIAAVAIAVVQIPGGHTRPVHHSPSEAPAPAVSTKARPEIVGLDGTTETVVPDVPSGMCCPNLSPDGSSIVFVRNGHIETIGVDGSGLRTIELPAGLRLPILGPGRPARSNPVWSPDGSQIAFQAMSGGNQDIYVMDANGSNVRRLTDSPFADEWAAWSPDGSTVVYDNLGKGVADEFGFVSTQEIYAVPASGGTSTRLTSNHVGDGEPSFSPDGRQIAFHRADAVWIMNADGTGAHEMPLPGDCCTGFTPRWSPDGTKIAFTRLDPATQYYSRAWGVLAGLRLFVVDVRTGAVSPVGNTEMPSTINAPQWLPSADGFLVYRIER